MMYLQEQLLKRKLGDDMDMLIKAIKQDAADEIAALPHILHEVHGDGIYPAITVADINTYKRRLA